MVSPPISILGKEMLQKMCIRDRAIPPHLPESNEQNLIVIEAFLEAEKRYARGGYDVIVDGIIGP